MKIQAEITFYEVILCSYSAVPVEQLMLRAPQIHSLNLSISIVQIASGSE